MIYYQVQHTTRFHYSEPISESVVEVQMQPRTEAGQRCLQFTLTTTPRAKVSARVDPLGNVVHFFDLPGQHTDLAIHTESIVEVHSLPGAPENLLMEEWDRLEHVTNMGDFWDMLMPSARVTTTDALRRFAAEIGIDSAQNARQTDPLTVLRRMNHAIYTAFGYQPDSTQVDSPIDDALNARMGVCQDFSHILLALTRGIGIPCRYVSGYLFYRKEAKDRSTPDASHAWVEAFFPSTGWVGFDPTNNILTGERHIRVAIGRDYNDVPPTRGVFKGAAVSDLDVAVHVQQLESSAVETLLPQTGWVPAPEAPPSTMSQSQQQQQQ